MPTMNSSSQPSLQWQQWIDQLAGNAYGASRAVAHLIDTGSPVVPRLVQILSSDASNEVASKIALILGKIGDPRSIPALEQAAIRASAGYPVGYQAVRALERLGAVEALIRVLQQTGESNRYWIVNALGKLKDPRAIDQMILLLDVENQHTRRLAAYLLGESQTEQGIYELQSRIQNPAYPSRWDAFSALYAASPETAINTWEAALQEASDEALISLLHSEYQMRNDHRVAAILARFAEHPNPKVREKVIRSFSSIQNAGLDVVRILVTATSDPSDAVREAAAYGFLFRRPKDPGPLIRLVQDLNSKVRASAIGALNYYQSKQMIPYLIQALDDSDDKVVSSALWGLAYYGDETAIDPLLRILNTQQRHDRSIGYALGRICDQNFVPILLKLLESPHSTERVTAIHVFGKIGAQEVLSNLEEMLDSSDRHEQAALAGTLGRWAKPEELPRLHQHFLQQDPYPFSEWIKALTQRKDSAAVPLLVDALSNEAGYDTAAEALGRLKYQPAIPGLIQLLQDRKKKRRFLAAYALGKIGDTQAFDALVHALQIDGAESAQMTNYAAQALAELGDPRAVPILMEALYIALYNDAFEWISYMAEALGKFASPEAVALLLQSLQQDHICCRQQAAWALGQIGDKRAIPFLISKASDKNLLVRQAVIQALSRFDAPEVTPALVDAYHSFEPEIQDMAIKGLSRCADQSGLEAVVEILKNGNKRRHRHLAGKALVHIGEPAIEKLISLYPGSNIRTRLSINWIIGHIGTEASVRWLVQVLQQEGDPRLRSKATQMLGRPPSPLSIDTLHNALNDPSEWVIIPAIFALVKSEDPDGKHHLQNLLQHAKPRIQDAARVALQLLE